MGEAKALYGRAPKGLLKQFISRSSVWMHKACKKTLYYSYSLPAYPITGRVEALLRYLALCLLLYLWLEFLYQPIEALAL
jgi:hypothetical protein